VYGATHLPDAGVDDAGARRPASFEESDAASDADAFPRVREYYVPPGRDRDPYADPYSIPDPFAAPTEPAGRAMESDFAAEDPTDPSAWTDEFEAWEEEPWDETEPVATPSARSRPIRSAARSPRARAMPILPTLRLPASFANGALLADPIALGLLGANLVSAALMAVVLGTQIGRLPASLVMHLDAAGLDDRWGPPRLLWRIPLLAFGITLMNAALAWFLAAFDRFAAHFVLAAALVVQVLAWIALIQFL
ncbi:MAG: hypothetical protein IT337_07225, partial [Thermomicrobiales bacterium]|nr:hypothetical protein [Thermomicrobiales bacterium]